MDEYNQLEAENGFLEPAEETDIALSKRKGFTLLSWLVILGFLALLVVRSNWKEGPGEAAQQERLQEIFFDMQARYLIGAANWAANFAPLNAQEFYHEAQALDRGSLEQRLKFVVVAGELAGPQEALHKALKLQGDLKKHATPRQLRLGNILKNLYRDYAAGENRAPSVSGKDRAFLREQLPWFGDLAFHPRAEVAPALAAPAGAAAALVLDQEQVDPAGRDQVLQTAYATFMTILLGVGSVCFLSFIGFIALVIFLILLAKRLLTGGLTTGSSHGGVYAETFALFLIFFTGLSMVLQWLPVEIPLLLKASMVTLGSLVVVGWPVLRGIAWTQVRQDIGWTRGRNPILEPAMGLACYVLALPIVLIGLCMTLVLMAVRNQLEGLGLGILADHEPIHPIVEFVVNGSTLDRILVFVDACILAPIVEETMFRGVLYRHLRELSQRWAWIWSVIFSGTVVSFIFAVIHPQGLVAVPVLMSLAYGFTIAREWRGSLVPSMTGHALNNGLVLLFVLLMMGK